MNKTFRVGELRRVIKESAESKNEFKPVYGKNVPEDNKKINDKAYNDIKKGTSNYDGGINAKRSKLESVTASQNGLMSDLEYENTPDKDRLEAQLRGYVSADAEKKHKNDPFGNATFTDNSYWKEHAKERKATRDADKGRGLTGSTKNKSDIKKETDTMFKESKKIKQINFKHMQFISEGHMLTKVPDEFKKEGNKFIMKDSVGNSYLVEWHKNGKADVEKKINKNVVNEEMDRIKSLYSYKSKDFFNTTNAQSRVAENKEFSDVLNKARKLMK